jgi:hypothetical protein
MSTTHGDALYVYGIVPAETDVTALDGVVGMGSELRLLVEGPVGALVEAVDPERPLGRRRDLVAHSTVLNALATHGPVLPMRFGSVVEGEDAVVSELLSPQREHFERLLEQVAGKVQFNLRARYVLDTVLAEIVASEPGVAELRRRTIGLPEDATHYDRIRLGELVAKAVEVRREQDSHHLVESLGPLAEDYSVREVSGMDNLAEISFLVDAEQQSRFERRAEVLAEEMDGRARLSLVGPMALYDFIPEQ